MSKFIYVNSGDDFAALNFENSGLKVDLELWNRVRNGEVIKDDDGFDMGLSALEYGEVDAAFLNFVLDELCDYDELKNRCIYKVEE